ncbi:MAG: LacI family DNA-binding transcriptional regulator [Candidatus Merdivicinus sp.]
MSVTIKQISEISGVSRGTVDRVLNGRGRVSPEKEALVRRVAEQLGYKPNLAGKALAARKKSYTIGVLLTAEGVSFFDEIIRGIRQAASELADYGITVLMKSIKGYDSKVQLREMEAMRKKVHVLILNPINEPAVISEINALTEEGIGVITLNTDVENSNRICYIGPDYHKSGEAACGMMGLLLAGKGKIGLFTGSVKILGHNQRIAGVRQIIRTRFPELSIADLDETGDDDVKAYSAASRMMKEYPDLDGIILVAAGSYGVCRAVLDRPDEQRPRIVAMDSVPTTVEMMQKGIIQATICQQPFTQGYQAVQQAFRYLVQGERPAQERIFTETEIRIRETV